LRQIKETKRCCKCISVLLALLLLLAPVQAAAAQQYPDVTGHWAEKTMRQGVADGFIVGAYGKLNPNQDITLSEVLTILNRVLGTERSGDVSGYGIPAAAWYRDEVARSVALGLLAGLEDKPSFAKALTRGDTFVVLVEAFQLMETETDVSCLSGFQDANALKNHNRAAAATLVQMGIVKGSGGLLMPQKSITRAEFMELLYRLIGSLQRADQIKAAPDGNVILSPKAEEPSPSPSESVEPSPSESVEPSPSESVDPSPSESVEPSPSESVDPSPSESVEPSPSESVDPSPSESVEPSPSESVEPSPSGVPMPTPDDGVRLLGMRHVLITGEAQNAPSLENMVSGQAAEDGNTAALENLAAAHRLIFNSKCHTVILQNVQSQNDVLIRADSLKRLDLTGGTVLKRLTVAALGGDVTINPAGSNRVETLRVGSGSGVVTVSGNVGRVEITGNNRHIMLRGVALSALVISGSNNRVSMFGGSSVDTIVTRREAAHSRIVVDGQVNTMTLNGKDSQVAGIGFIGSVLVVGAGSAVSAKTGSYRETIDRTLEEVHIALRPSSSVVQPGGKLTVTATFTNVGLGKVCSVQWYQNGAAVSGQGNSGFAVTEGKTASFSPPIAFFKEMKLSVTVGLSVTYVSGTRVDTVYKTVTVPIQNYPASHYYGQEAKRVLNLVSPRYTGQRNDYSAADKEIFVNVKGYSSPSRYLIWVNLATQRINVFSGSKENWKLIRTGLVGTGKASTPTPVGVFYVTRKQTGWFTPTYTVKPVVRFSAGSGYAFHSRLYYPGTTRLQDGRIGLPVSHGCIRMYDEDIQWLYNNAPIGTTVAVY
jgi:lipoprotein-anchoring transpeptidase ErfK/SrfK